MSMNLKKREIIKTKIVLIVDNCSQCPKCNQERTPEAGYAFDYYCTMFKNPKKVMGYIEWEHEKEPIPEWCPLRLKKS